MSIFSQVSALFDAAPPEPFMFTKRKYANRIDIFLFHHYISTFKLRIFDNNIVQYLLKCGGKKIILKTFELTEISLSAIIDPIYSKEFMIEVVNLFSEIKISDEYLTINLRFEVTESGVEIYKRFDPFPEIYYKKLTNVINLLKYKMMSMSYIDEDDKSIITLLTDKCETRTIMIKARI
jgi:hypothetical protein